MQITHTHVGQSGWLDCRVNDIAWAAEFGRLTNQQKNGDAQPAMYGENYADSNRLFQLD
ncbi:MAG: hypothetical protein JWQ23_2354 [Herminiimonas sp.]|nr:hypothetical protein [Herminiimonas sp.]